LRFTGARTPAAIWIDEAIIKAAIFRVGAFRARNERVDRC
jgi:hypothetical protein